MTWRGNARKEVPFADSSLAIHNISRRADREKAIEEAVRVLRPGGRLLIADVHATRHIGNTPTDAG